MGFDVGIEFTKGFREVGESLAAGCFEGDAPVLPREDGGDVLIFSEEDAFDAACVGADTTCTLAIDFTWGFLFGGDHGGCGEVLEAAC